MPTIYGLNGDEIRPEADFRIERNDSGGVAASQSFHLLTSSINPNRFAIGTPYLSLDPQGDQQWRFLTVASWSIENEEGGVTTARIRYTGSASASYPGDEAANDGAKYHLSFTEVDMPFSNHEKWKELGDADKIRLNYLIDGSYQLGEDGKLGTIADDGSLVEFGEENQLEAENAKEFANLIASGETTYLMPVFRWTESVQGEDGLTSAQLNKAGKISTPRGNPPTPTGGRDWRLTGATQDQDGKLITTHLEWTLSDRGGHNSFLYE